MQDYDTNADKTDGFTLKPARVETRDNQTYDAVNHVINPSEQTLGLHIDERDGGIDVKIPLSNVAVIAQSPAGARAIDESVEENELAADGGDI
ncbi:hypothetical protein [Halorubrum coriense]|uniref:hypothetical protein n=1 Tax=Halorubrum coriense TaxID=64713 RepID=UPI0012678DC2|nr:hypothetical protein [Halorubrum coriense]